MAPSRIRRLSSHTFQAGEPILFDANVWLFLYPPPSGSFDLPGAYSTAFKAALHARSRILSNVLILSEYLNAYVRKEWQDSGQGSFKSFRESEEFRSNVGPTAAFFARRILASSELVDIGLNMPAVEFALQTFETGALDANDGLIVWLCRENGWTLVTHDRDFQQADIAVLTENGRLLNNAAPPRPR